jgi:hypothetical protein
MSNSQEAGVDGEGLLQLRELLKKDVEVFYGAVEKSLKISKFGLVCAFLSTCPSVWCHIFFFGWNVLVHDKNT